MNLARMNHLITVLEGVERAKKRFDLTSWVSNKIDVDTCSGEKPVVAEACGTSACALGYAALDPVFQAEGLGFEVAFADQFGKCRTEMVKDIASFNKAIKAPDFWRMDPIFGDREGLLAAREFFGITISAAGYLFDPETYDDGNSRPVLPSEVIERVREVMDNDGDSPGDRAGLRHRDQRHHAPIRRAGRLARLPGVLRPA